MNNPYLPLSNYFREDQRFSNYHKRNEKDIYMPYVKKREELIRQFTPASNMNPDNLTDKIGRENAFYNRIPYEMFQNENNKQYQYDPYYRYQRDFNDYDNLNKKIYNFSRTPYKNPVQDNNSNKYEIEPITSLEYDRDNYCKNDENNKKLSSQDYQEYFDYMNNKQKNLNYNQYNHYNNVMPSNNLSIHYTPQKYQNEDNFMDSREYQKRLREREEQLLQQYKNENIYRQYSPRGNSVLSQEMKNEVPLERSRIKSSHIKPSNNGYGFDELEGYSNIMSKIAKKNLISVNPCMI